MKRLLTPSSRVLSRVNDPMEEKSTNKVIPVTEKINRVQEKSLKPEAQKDKQTMENREKVLEQTHGLKEDHPKKDAQVTEKIKRTEEKTSISDIKKDKQMAERKVSILFFYLINPIIITSMMKFS